MGIYQETLWKKFEEKAMAADEGKPVHMQYGHEYITAVKSICNYAVPLTKTIRDMFPLYTLHDEEHICNIMRLMENLLGDDVEKLSRDEMAMLILAACCHDLGMSCSKEQAIELLDDGERLERYFETHPSAYLKAKNRNDVTELPDDILCDFLRSIHHERVNDILLLLDWPAILQGKVDCQELIQICQSHGENVERILNYESTTGVDLRMCAILLRLADILDFDTSRAPQAVYYYSGFDKRTDPASRFSKEEWNKHAASHGFSFENVKNRLYPYDLPYNATCPNMKIEQAINTYIDWIDKELAACQSLLRYCDEKWRNFILPRKIMRNIKAKGYISGQFCLTLDQEKVLELLVGKNLYQDPGVFVRELVQNAIDAVRTREKLDKNIPRDWRPQINIRCWMDEEGYHWFRIEDNGIGMNEEIIKKYFLKVGCSYYASSDFEQEKYRNHVAEGYTPISRFGIGILSCFMGDKNTNQVEISTKHYSAGSNALRMSMDGLSGYYYLANRKVCPQPIEMKGILSEEKKGYRNKPGTAIAVRTNLYQSGKFHSFKEILDHYIVYPVVPIHYEDEKESFDYPTEQDLMDAMHGIQPSEDPNKRGILEFSPTDEQIWELEQKIPGLSFEEKPKVILKCIALDQCTESDYLSGAVLLTKVHAGKYSCSMKMGTERVEAELKFSPHNRNNTLILNIELTFSSIFKQRMNMYETQARMLEKQWDEAIYSMSTPLEKEILYAIQNGYDMEQSWPQWILDEPEQEQQIIREKVEVIRKIIKEKSLNARDKLTYQEYQKLSFNHQIQLVDLEKYAWYKRFWIRDNDKHISLAAHNGVMCGDAEFFLFKSISAQICKVILLLKDVYRPEVDIARMGVQQLPLDAILELEMLKDEWQQQGFDVKGGSDIRLKNIGYWRLPLKVYSKVLDMRPDLVKRFCYNTNQGTFYAEEISEKLHEFGKLIIENCPPLKNYYSGYLCEYFCMAYLCKTFRVRGIFDEYSGKIVVLPQNGSRLLSYTEDFPPLFFLPIEGEGQVFTSDYYYPKRVFCNEAHPLSQYIIAKGDLLRKLVPGLYQELMHSIASDGMENMISKVNMCLTNIQSLPHEELKVPANAFLKESDFFN